MATSSWRRRMHPVQVIIDHPFLYCIVRMVENPNTKVGGVVPLFVGHTREPNVN